MKLRFPTCDSKRFLANGQVPTYVAINTDEITAWRLDNPRELEVWFKGVSESICLTEERLGVDNFIALLGVLGSEFPHITDLKLNIDQ